MEQEINRCQETRVMGISFRGPIIHETWYLPDASLGIWRASGLNEAREEEGEAAGAVETSRQKHRVLCFLGIVYKRDLEQQSAADCITFQVADFPVSGSCVPAY